MKIIANRRSLRHWLTAPWMVLAVVSVVAPVRPAGASSGACVKIGIEAEVSAGKEWSVPLGQGWVFRVTPIQPAGAGYSGWDLVVDRDPAAGYPDALLVATMPYNSINEREIGTTFGLRSQDAIGWNPRSFRFLTDASAFRESQQLFRSITGNGAALSNVHRAGTSSGSNEAIARMLEFEKRASFGEFRILDAHLVPGVADPAPYAQGWASASSWVPHEVDSSADGKSSARGALNWMRFGLSLWLPARWNVPHGLHTLPAVCPE